jgi:hypothetical protein
MAKKNILIVTGDLLDGFTVCGPFTEKQADKRTDNDNMDGYWRTTLMDKGADDTDMDDISAGGEFVVLAGDLAAGFSFYGPCDSEGSDSLCHTLGGQYPHVMTIELTKA